MKFVRYVLSLTVMAFLFYIAYAVAHMDDRAPAPIATNATQPDKLGVPAETPGELEFDKAEASFKEGDSLYIADGSIICPTGSDLTDTIKALDASSHRGDDAKSRAVDYSYSLGCYGSGTRKLQGRVIYKGFGVAQLLSLG
jgi:hypothetical protein